MAFDQGIPHRIENRLDGELGIAVGQQMSAALAGKTTVDAALKAGQVAADREMKKAGYYK